MWIEVMIRLIICFWKVCLQKVFSLRNFVCSTYEKTQPRQASDNLPPPLVKRSNSLSKKVWTKLNCPFGHAIAWAYTQAHSQTHLQIQNHFWDILFIIFTDKIFGMSWKKSLSLLLMSRCLDKSLSHTGCWKKLLTLD